MPSTKQEDGTTAELPIRVFSGTFSSGSPDQVVYYREGNVCHILGIKEICAPLEILTNQGTQFMNQTLTHLTSISGIRHHLTIPYSKEENGIVELANQEVNRHI